MKGYSEGMENVVFYKVADIAKLFDVNHVTIRNLIKRGELRALRVGRGVRVSKAALEEYLHRIEYPVVSVRRDEEQSSQVG